MYKRIKERYQALSSEADYLIFMDREDDARLATSEMDCIDHFFGAGGAEEYSIAAKWCRENGYDTVFDIGCAFGHQSECFLEESIEYVGIDDSALGKKWNADRYKYLIGKYPFKIPEELLKGNYIGISRLCVGCLITGEEAMEQIANTFEKLLICSGFKQSELEKYYTETEQIPTTYLWPYWEASSPMFYWTLYERKTGRD